MIPVGGWRLAVGGWQLAVGGWQLKIVVNFFLIVL